MRTIPIIIAFILMPGLHGVSHAAEPSSQTQSAFSSSDRGRSDEEAIIQAVEGFAVGYIQRDLEMLMGLWDAKAADEVSFIQVENELPVIGLQNFRANYIFHLQQIITLGGDVSDVHIQRMGNLAIVSCRFTWVSQYVATGHVSVDSTRATVVLRKHGQRWLYVHMHESITYS